MGHQACHEQHFCDHVRVFRVTSRNRSSRPLCFFDSFFDEDVNDPACAGIVNKGSKQIAGVACPTVATNEVRRPFFFFIIFSILIPTRTLSLKWKLTCESCPANGITSEDCEIKLVASGLCATRKGSKAVLSKCGANVSLFFVFAT